MGVRSGCKFRNSNQRLRLYDLLLHVEYEDRFCEELFEQLPYSRGSCDVHCCHFAFAAQNGPVLPTGQTAKRKVRWAFADVEFPQISFIRYYSHGQLFEYHLSRTVHPVCYKQCHKHVLLVLLGLGNSTLI